MFSKQNRSQDDNSLAPVKGATSTIKKTSAESVPSIISSDLKIVGNLICGGSIEIEGAVEGNVTCESVTVRREGAVTGDVVADTVQVDGEINGLVKGKEITLSESGRVTGVLMYETLSVKNGAYIDGQCKSSDNSVHHGKVEALEISQEENIAYISDTKKKEEAVVN